MAISTIRKNNIYYSFAFNQQDGTVETLVNNIVADLKANGLTIVNGSWKNHPWGHITIAVKYDSKKMGIIFDYANNKSYIFEAVNDEAPKIHQIGG